MKKGRTFYKATAIILSVLLLLSTSVVFAESTAITAYIDESVRIKVDNQFFTPKDSSGNIVPPVIAFGRTYLPVRVMAEVLDVDVGWDANTHTILLTKKSSSGLNNLIKGDTSSGGSTERKPINAIATTDMKIKVNNENFVPRDVDGSEFRIVVINGRAYLPVEAIASAFDVDYSWSRTSNTVLFTRKIDLGGKIIKVVYDTNANTSPGAKPTSSELLDAPKLIAKYNAIEEAKSKMNFKINWVYKSSDNLVSEYIEACAAGTNYADIILSSTKRVFPSLVAKDLLIPLDKYIDFENDPVYNLGSVATGTEFLGKRWGLVEKPYKIGYVAFYNRAIFKQEGLTDLQKLYEEGKWTWDTMVDIAKKVAKDLNGDGKMDTNDQYGVLFSNVDTGAHALALSNGADFLKYDSSSNSYKVAANDPKVKKAIQLIDDLIAEGYSTPNSGVKFDKNPVAIVIGKTLGDGASYLKAGMDYGVVPLPKGPDVSGTDYKFAIGDGIDAFFIPKNTDADISALVIKEAFTYWDTDKATFLTPGDLLMTDLKKGLGSEADIKWTINNYSTPYISQLRSFNTFRNNINNKIIVSVAWDTDTLDNAIATNSELLQTNLDDALKP